MSIESAAAAMFARYHEINARPRRWDQHPDEDNGPELGRETFRAMAEAAEPHLQPESAPAAETVAGPAGT